MAPPSLLFVCLGNICRSPMAEAVFAHEAKLRGFEVEIDSAGTGAYHVGDTPDERSVATCVRKGVAIDSRARQVKQSDFDKFDYIFAMDDANLRNLQNLQPKDGKAKLMMFSAFGDKKAIKDPYYGGNNGFDKSFEQCTEYSRQILDHVASEEKK